MTLKIKILIIRTTIENYKNILRLILKIISLPLLSAGTKLEKVILQGSGSLLNYLYSGDIPDLEEVLPYEDNTDYTFEDYIDDNGVVVTEEDEFNESDDHDSLEPDAKKFRGDNDDSSLIDGHSNDSRDWDSGNKMNSFGNNSNNFNNHNNFSNNNFGGNMSNQNQPSGGSGIPSLLNLNIAPPKLDNGQNGPPDLDRSGGNSRERRSGNGRASRWSRR